MDSDKKIEALS